MLPGRAGLAQLLDGLGARGLLREWALADDDPGQRIEAIDALASSRGERAVDVVARALRDDLEPNVRMSPIRALGRAGCDWARGHLRRATRDLDPEISLAAEEALASGRRTSGTADRLP